MCGQHGVELVSKSVSICTEAVSVGPGVDRSLCKQLEPSTAALCVSMPGSSSHVGQCAGRGVASGRRPVRVSPDNDHGSCASQDNQRAATPPLVDRPSPPGSSLVSAASAASLLEVNCASSADRRPAPAALGPRSPVAAPVQPAPVVHMFPALKAKGFSDAVIDAYRSLESASDDVIDSLHVKAHQVRHVAHSLGQLGNLSLTDIIRTGD